MPGLFGKPLLLSRCLLFVAFARVRTGTFICCSCSATCPKSPFAPRAKEEKAICSSLATTTTTETEQKTLSLSRLCISSTCSPSHYVPLVHRRRPREPRGHARADRKRRRQRRNAPGVRHERSATGGDEAAGTAPSCFLARVVSFSEFTNTQSFTIRSPRSHKPASHGNLKLQATARESSLSTRREGRRKRGL